MVVFSCFIVAICSAALGYLWSTYFSSQKMAAAAKK